MTGRTLRRTNIWPQDYEATRMVDGLVLKWTHCKPSEDVGSGSNADTNHAVDPAEKPPVTVRLGMNLHTLPSISYQKGHSLELSHHRGQHFSQLVHGWVAITGNKSSMNINMYVYA